MDSDAGPQHAAGGICIGEPGFTIRQPLRQARRKKMLLNDYLDEYLISLVVEKGLSKSTIESYKNDLKQFLT